MVEIFFYQSDGPPKNLLFTLLERSRSQEWNVLVLCSDQDEVNFLHDQLWVQPENRFVGIGKAGTEYDELQPVLISDKTVYSNNPHVVILSGNCEVQQTDIKKFKRVMVIFNQNDQVELEASRQKWKTLSKLGCHMKLFRQNNSRWSLQAEANQNQAREIESS